MSLFTDLFTLAFFFNLQILGNVKVPKDFCCSHVSLLNAVFGLL